MRLEIQAKMTDGQVTDRKTQRGKQNLSVLLLTPWLLKSLKHVMRGGASDQIAREFECWKVLPEDKVTSLSEARNLNDGFF